MFPAIVNAPEEDKKKLLIDEKNSIIEELNVLKKRLSNLNIKDVEDHSWFFNSPDPRIKKHLDYINTSCDGDPKKIKSKTVWWWYNLAVIWCSSLDDDYGRYNRELDRNPNLVMGCQTSEMMQKDNIKYPRRDGF